MYVLVLLDDRPGHGTGPPDHEPFVDSLVERQLVLMGGPLEPDGAAYVLRCDTLEQARALVATDPLVSSGAVTATVRPWELVGVDPRLIDPSLVIGDDRP